jgi:hypothetical protein
MLSGQDVSLRKVRRKLAADGPAETATAAAEFLCRKVVLTPLFRRLLDAGRPPVIADKCLPDVAPRYYPLDGSVSPDSGQSFVAGMDCGYVLSATGMGLTPGGIVVGATISEPAGRPRKTGVVLERQAVLGGPKTVADLVAGRVGALDSAARHIGPLAPMIPRYRNYFHWLIECLPRLRGIRAYEERSGTDVSLLVPADLPEWIFESLRLVGVPKDRLVPAETAVYRTSDLVVPSFPLPTAAECAWIRAQVLERAAEDVGVETGTNVYISRTGATERTVRNEDAVVSALSEYGFESYRLEELSVAAQARLFDEADLIVGAHGAGLSNLVFCTDGAALELFGKKVKSNYANIAETVGIHYESLQCAAAGVDLVVDTDRLVNVVGALDDRA